MEIIDGKETYTIKEIRQIAKILNISTVETLILLARYKGIIKGGEEYVQWRNGAVKRYSKNTIES